MMRKRHVDLPPLLRSYSEEELRELEREMAALDAWLKPFMDALIVEIDAYMQRYADHLRGDGH